MPRGIKTGGRRAGTPNKITAAFKQAVQRVFDDGGGHVWLLAWAKENPTEFFKIAAKLIPAQLQANVGPTAQLADLLREARERRQLVVGGTVGGRHPSG